MVPSANRAVPLAANIKVLPVASPAIVDINVAQRANHQFAQRNENAPRNAIIRAGRAANVNVVQAPVGQGVVKVAQAANEAAKYNNINNNFANADYYESYEYGYEIRTPEGRFVRIGFFLKKCKCGARFSSVQICLGILNYIRGFARLPTGTHSHEERKIPTGQVFGSYSMSLADGRRRLVTYSADGEGFHPVVETNELGTLTSEPADVKIFSSSATETATATGAGAVSAAPVAPVTAFRRLRKIRKTKAKKTSS